MTHDTHTLREGLIRNAVDRFLGWKLPENFSPDGGISFKPTFNEQTNHPMRHKPTGTNLFTAQEAEEMVRYILGDALTTYGDAREAAAREEERERIELVVNNCTPFSIGVPHDPLISKASALAAITPTDYPANNTQV